MRQPHFVLIGPYEFDIEYTERLVDDDQKLNGRILYDDARIDVENNVSDQCKRTTVVHEILHGCSTFSNAGLTEEQVELMAYQVTEVLQRNPQLFDMFKDGVK